MNWNELDQVWSRVIICNIFFPFEYGHLDQVRRVRRDGCFMWRSQVRCWFLGRILWKYWLMASSMGIQQSKMGYNRGYNGHITNDDFVRGFQIYTIEMGWWSNDDHILKDFKGGVLWGLNISLDWLSRSSGFRNFRPPCRIFMIICVSHRLHSIRRGTPIAAGASRERHEWSRWTRRQRSLALKPVVWTMAYFMGAPWVLAADDTILAHAKVKRRRHRHR